MLARAILAGPQPACVVRLTQQLRESGTGLVLLRDVGHAVARADTSRLRDLLRRARAYASALEIAGARDVLEQLVEAHPVEQLLGLEHAVRRWLDHGAAPVDLLPLVPELRAYVAARVKLDGLRTLLAELDKLTASRP